MRFYRFLSAPILIAVLFGMTGSDRALHAQTVSMTRRGVPSVSYNVSANTATESFQISATFNNIERDTLRVHFPIWGPGAYDIVNFGAYVHDFTATSSAGKALKVMRGDTNTFMIIGGDAKVSVAYKVADIESVPNSLWFGLSDIEKGYAFANTVAIFGYPEGLKDIPYTVKYNVPKGWDIAIGLDPAREKGSYAARDYDELVDAPLMMGKFQRFEFEVNGKPHIIAVIAPKKLDKEGANALVEETEKIVRTISDFFGGDMPYDRYVFQHFLVTPDMGDAMFGALEHRNSSTYRMPVFDLSNVAQVLRSVIAHEYWHLWSPKRIHVRELGPFNYQSAPRTNSLWFAEGLTEYYAQVLLARNGMNPPRGMVTWLNQMVGSYHGKKQSQSIGELSMRISEIDPMDAIGLYTKGPTLGLLLDIAIRTQTGNAKSLDDAMRYLNDTYGKTGRTFGDDEIIPEMERATGTKLGEFYQRYITGLDPLPFDEYLPKIGLKLATQYEERRSLGAELAAADSGWQITAITPGGSADQMKMQVGDVITEINMKRSGFPTQSMPVSYASSLTTMRDVQGFTILRNGAEMKIEAKIGTAKVPSTKVEVDASASAEALAMRKSIFGF